MVTGLPPRQPRRPRIAGIGDMRDTLRKDHDDSAAGCRERAADDLVKAAAMETANGRRVLELSAASWTARATLLQRLEDKFDERKESRSDKEPEDDGRA